MASRLPRGLWTIQILTRRCSKPPRNQISFRVAWGGVIGTGLSYVVDVGSEWDGPPRRGAVDAAALVDERLEALLAAATGPVNWREVGSDEARERWVALRGWVEWFRLEFGFDHRVVPPCWYRHPALVSVLSALRDHWVCAYDPLNTPIGAADWHRSLMQLEVRLRDWASRTGCTVSEHRPDVAAVYPDDTQAWEAHVDEDVAARAARAAREMSTAVSTAERAFGTPRD